MAQKCPLRSNDTEGEVFSFVQSRMMRLPNTNGYLQVIALILQEHGEAFGSNSHPYI